VFREADHVLFMSFGQFMTAIGGSLFQCALPLALASVFLRKGNYFGVIVCVWWAGRISSIMRTTLPTRAFRDSC
jgi:hypothetical protein